MKSKLISLSAISAAFVALALVIGAYVELADICSLVLSSVFAMMPLYYKSYKASVLAALAGGLIAFMCSGFNIMSIVFPSFIAFFGVYPIVRFKLSEMKFKVWLIYIIGAIWCLLTVYGIYFYYTLVMNIPIGDLPYLIAENILYFIAPIGLIVYFIYDKFLVVSKLIMDKYLTRIVK